jgi:hypothetical protein
MRLQEVSIKNLGAGFLGAGLLAMLLAAPGMAAAQDEKEVAKPPQQEEPKQEAQPKDVKPEQAPAKNDARPPKPEERNGQPEEKKNEPMKTQEARPQGNAAHATPAAQGRRIPDEKFHSSFGRQHTFKVQRTVIVEGQPRFQYSGYSFALVDPWPVGWAYTDDCYVDYIDGEYVLIDLLHPGVQIVLIVVG